MKKIKPLIYKLSLNWWRTVCPYCFAEKPDNEAPVDVCPVCGGKYDLNCEVRMTKDFIAANPEYVARLWHNPITKTYRQQEPERQLDFNDI